MKQPVTLSRTLMESSDKETSIRKSSTKEAQNELYPEDLNNLPNSHSKEGSNFDFSNFGMFFKNKDRPMKNPNELAPSFASNRKRSSETSSNRETTMKRLPSKEFSNLDELNEDTTVISNAGEVIRSQSKKVSTELSHFKPAHEETKEVTHEGPLANSTEKGASKKENFPSVFSGLIKILKEEKPEQDLLGSISKLTVGAGAEEDHEKVEASIFKDTKFSTSNINVEVMERIKTKALHHRHSSLANSANISNASSSGSSNVAQSGHSESRTNNNSVFTGIKKMNKSSTPFNNFIKKETEDFFQLDPVKNSVNSMLNNFEPEISADVLKIEDLIQISPKAKDFNPQSQNVLTKSIDGQDLANSYDANENKKSRLSTLATDSTVDSENFNTLTFNSHNRPLHHHHSNSFSTFFNGKSNSYNNSGKTDYSSPLRVDSARFNDVQSNGPNLNVADFQPNHHSGPLQGNNLFNFDPQLISFYSGGFGSNNNTDSSNSLSWNDEYVNSNLSLSQERQGTSFLNQSLTINPSASMDINYMSSAQISPQTLKNRVNRSYTAHAGNKSTQGISPVNNAQFKEANPISLNKEAKDPTKPKKKNHDAKDAALYEIDLTRLDANGKTTLMIRNIPNKYDLPLMLQAIEKNHRGKFDFFYLPIDPRNKCNVGYAFINFNEPRHIRDFVIEFNNKKWEKFNSEKICDIKYGRIQGKKALMHHFQYSNVMNQQDKKLKPYFSVDYDGMNNQRIKDLVNKQRLESVDDNLESHQE